MFYQLAVTKKRSPWVYVEGFAVRPCVGFPIHHAWVTHRDFPTLAYDLAWENAEGCVYLGIPFKAEYVRSVFLASRRQYYSVLENWDYPLLSGTQAIDPVIWVPGV